MGNVYLQFEKAAVERQTERAVMVVCEDEKIWLPKSQISNFVEKDGKIDLTIPDWLAKKTPVLANYLDPVWVNAGCPD